MRTSVKIRAEITQLQARLEALRQLGVFRIVPKIEPHSRQYPESQVLAFRVFKSNGQRNIIIDPKVKFTRRLSLPRWRDEEKYNQLLKMKDRTEHGEQLIIEINLLQQKLEAAEKREMKAAALKVQAKRLRQAARQMEQEAIALSA